MLLMKHIDAEAGDVYANGGDAGRWTLRWRCPRERRVAVYGKEALSAILTHTRLSAYLLLFVFR